MGLVGMLDDDMPPEDEPWMWPPYALGSIDSELAVLRLLSGAGLDDDDASGDDTGAVGLGERLEWPRRLVEAVVSLSLRSLSFSWLDVAAREGSGS